MTGLTSQFPQMEVVEFMTLILSNDDVEKLLTMSKCIEVLEDAYVELNEGRGVIPNPWDRDSFEISKSVRL